MKTTMQECEAYADELSAELESETFVPVGKTMYFVHYLLEYEGFSFTACETIEEANETLSNWKSLPDFIDGYIVVGQRI